MSASGQTAFFTPAFYHALQMRLRVISGVNIALVVIMIICRLSLTQTLSRVLHDARSLLTDTGLALRSVPKLDRFLLVFLLLIAAIFRVSLLTQTMRYDEAYTFLQYSSHPFYAALSFYNAPNNHLLNTLLVRVAYLCLGNHPWALRLPAFLAGLCLVPATYFAYTSLYRVRGALVSAGLVASSSVLIEYSTNARGYIMLGLIFVAMIPVAVYGLRHENWAAWSLLGVLSALGFYAIPIMLYPLGGLLLWIFRSALTAERPHLRLITLGIGATTLVSALLTFELYSPVLAVSGPRSLIANKWVTSSPSNVFFRQLPGSFVATWREWNRSIPVWLALTLAVMFAISIVWHRRCSNQSVPLAFALIVWILAVLCIQRVVPFERVWLFALPVYFIQVSAGLAMLLDFLLARFRFSVAASTLAALSLLTALYMGFALRTPRAAYLDNDCRGLDGLIPFLKLELKPGDSVAVDLPSDIPLLYYFQRNGILPSLINSEAHGRVFVVVNESAGDSVRKVLESTKFKGDVEAATPIVKSDSVALYQLPGSF